MGEYPKQKKSDKRFPWLSIVGLFLLLIAAIGAVVWFVIYPRTLVIGDSKSLLGNKVGNNIGDSAGNSGGNSANATTGVYQAAQSLSVLVQMSSSEIILYNQKLLQLANLPPLRVVRVGTSTHSTVSTSSGQAATTTVARGPVLWPVKTTYPDAGAILPFKRIVAYYGNFYSTQMGILGQYPPAQVLQMLSSTVAEWNAADPTTPVVPAIDYIAVTAQGSPGADGDYRLRMPASQIEEAITLAGQVNGVVFLDVQVGLSTVEQEVPLLAQYLKLPQVELSLDPEFDMHNGERPGTVIGTMDASDINFAANYLANLVRENNLPPKILVVHRFTQEMVTNTQDITPLPEVQIVMDMDGFGFPAKKINTYQNVIVDDPVQFTGFKLFFKNDAAGPMGHLMTPSEVLQLSPQPSYIQYQ